MSDTTDGAGPTTEDLAASLGMVLHLAELGRTHRPVGGRAVVSHVGTSPEFVGAVVSCLAR